MSVDAQPVLSLVAEQLHRLIGDVGSLRDDVTVLTAIVIRRDHTLSALLTEVRALEERGA